MLIPLAGFAFGFAFGRWWALLAVIPFASWILATNELEAFIGLWITVLLSGLLACAIGAGVALRRLRDRRLHA
jgi:hypothetical protein